MLRGGNISATLHMNVDPDGSGPRVSREFQTTMKHLSASNLSFVIDEVNSMTLTDVTKHGGTTTMTFLQDNPTAAAGILGALHLG
jgi:hypothetical protein